MFVDRRDRYHSTYGHFRDEDKTYRTSMDVSLLLAMAIFAGYALVSAFAGFSRVIPQYCCWWRECDDVRDRVTGRELHGCVLLLFVLIDSIDDLSIG